MEKGSDISKNVALVLIILTVLISATSTWVLVTSSSSAEPGPSINNALIHLNILRGRPAAEQPVTDMNAGNARIFIAKSKGG